jgi:hypothetical protein
MSGMLAVTPTLIRFGSLQDYMDQLNERNDDMWRIAARASGSCDRAVLA